MKILQHTSIIACLLLLYFDITSQDNAHKGGSTQQWVDPHDMNFVDDMQYFDKVPERSQFENAKPLPTQSEEVTLKYLKRFISLMLNSAQKNEAGSSRVSGSYVFDKESIDYQFLSKFLDQKTVGVDDLRKLDTILSNTFSSSTSQQMLDSVLSFQDKFLTVLFSINTLLIVTTSLSIYIVYGLLKSNFSFWYVVRYIILIVWIFDFGLRYKMMYEESENHNMHVRYSLECDTNRMTWVEWIKYVADGTKCKEKQMVNPLDVILQQLKYLIVIPLSAVGTGMGAFGKEVWTQVGYPWNIVIFPILLLFTALITAIILTAVNNKSFKIKLFHLLHFEFGDQQQQPNTVAVNLTVENNPREVDHVQQIEDNYRLRNRRVLQIEQNNIRIEQQPNQNDDNVDRNQVGQITENEPNVNNIVTPVPQETSKKENKSILNELPTVVATNSKERVESTLEQRNIEQSKSGGNNNETKIQTHNATEAVRPNGQNKISSTTEPSHKECDSTDRTNCEDNCSDYGSSTSSHCDQEFEVISNADDDDS